MKERFLKLWNALPGRTGCILLGLALLAGCVFGVRAGLDPYDCRMAEGVSIGGMDVAGMTRRQARQALTAALEDSLYSQPLTLKLPQDTLILYPEDLHAKVQVRSAVNTAYRCGRKDAIRDVPLLPWLKLDEDNVKSLLQEYAAQWDTQLSQSQWSLSGQRPELATDSFDPAAPCQTLVLTLGVPRQQLDVTQVYGDVLIACGRAPELCAAGDFSVTPEAQPEAFPELPDVDAIWQQVAVAPVDDSLDLEAYTFVPGSYGYGFDAEAARELVRTAAWGQTLEIPLSVSEPDILGQEVYFRDVLGSCETKHTDDENRNTNLRLLCEALDGHIIQPGEEFSYNMTVGERTAERGYKPATAYSGKRMIKDIGGGVCQGSTTLYNCALLADVEILERVCHGAKVGYIKLGLDAAVNWNTKTDLRFKNNFHFPIMIRAEVSDGYVKMQLLGTDEKDYYVEMYCKSGAGEGVTYASSYKKKIHKETGEILSDELEARSAYYELS